MRRSLPILLVLCCATPSLAVDRVPTVLVEELRWLGLTPDDLAGDWRETVNRGLQPPPDPWRVASDDLLTASPLTFLARAEEQAERLQSDVAAGSGGSWSGFFSLARAELRIDGADPCPDEPTAAPSLVARSVAWEAEQGVKRSRREVRALQESLDSRLDTRLGALVAQADRAKCRLDAAFAELDDERRAAVASAIDSSLGDLAPGTAEAEVTMRLLTDAWAATDRAALLLAGEAWAEALLESAHTLASIEPEAWPTDPMIFATAHGEVWIGSPASNSGTGDPFLVVDPGGDDHWRILPDRTELMEGTRAVRGWLDLGGNDIWQTGVAGAGAAVLGVSAGVDLAGDDTWRGRGLCGAAAAFGVSTWLDAGGTDMWLSGPGSQGFASFGAAALRDLGDGDDSYRAAGLAQGTALPAGVALLHDVGGDDLYEVDDAGGQGLSLGLFPLIGGGTAWLLDQSGDDTYRTEGPGQASCDAHGAAVVMDLGGDDSWSADEAGAQAAARSECTALLVERSGDDRYVSGRESQAWAELRGTALLVDREGDDRYEIDEAGQGFAGWGGTAVLLDGGGRDGYATGGHRTSDGPSPADWPGLLVDGSGSGHFDHRPRPMREPPVPPAPLPTPGSPEEAAQLVRDSATDPSTGAAALVKAGPGVAPAVLALVSAARPAETEVVHRYISRGAGAGSADQRRVLTQAIAADALARDQSAADGSVRWHLVWMAALAGYHPEAVEDSLKVAAALRDHPAWRVRSKALLVYQAIAGNPQLEIDPVDLAEWEGFAAVALQSDPDPEVRWAALDLLEAVGGAGVASIVASALRDGDSITRVRAERALRAIAQRTDGLSVARGLFPLTEPEESGTVRDAALRLLGSTGHREAWDVLEPALGDGDPRIRRAAAIGAAELLPNRKVEQALAGRLEVEQDERVKAVLPAP